MGGGFRGDREGVKMEMKMKRRKKRKEAKWRAMMVAEEGDVDAVVVDSAVEVDSVAVEVSVEQGSAVAAELGVLEEDSGVEEVDSVEVMTEERAALNSADSFAITSFSKYEFNNFFG